MSKLALMYVTCVVGAVVLTGAAAQKKSKHSSGSPQSATIVEAPAKVADPEYPLKLHIITSEQDNYDDKKVGAGAANLLGDKPIGIDYSFKCKTAIGKNSTDDEFYSGKWKKQDKEIEVRSQDFGTDKVHKCVLQVVVEAKPYTDEKSTPTLPPLPQYTAPAPPQQSKKKK